eukprot:TRINITY_DN9424_c0_g1_i1.p1 TRINITY_DN9424_c0_g1~~TRINITY_DN9424_c0_g1_i1.p1  ORF type:complete len:114 (-),score=20.70 TRINITY_DN9424_c0_g1_i1:124-465(-)
MSYFNPQTPVEAKRRVLFQAIDADRDGYLSFSDLLQFYAKCVFAVPNLNAHALSSSYAEELPSSVYSMEDLSGIVRGILEVHDVDRDGMLSFKEYTDVVTDWDVKEFIDVYLV